VNPAYLGEELAFVLRQSRARGIIVQDVYRNRNLVQAVNAARDALPDLREVIARRWRYPGQARPDRLAGTTRTVECYSPDECQTRESCAVLNHHPLRAIGRPDRNVFA
jgi:hypothetical protein